jgi:hypothetical protein
MQKRSKVERRARWEGGKVEERSKMGRETR